MSEKVHPKRMSGSLRSPGMRHAAPVPEAENNVTGNDIASNELQLLKRALSAIQNGVMITDASASDDPIIFVNRAFERITGYASEEVLGRNPRFLQAGDDAQPTLEEFRENRNSRNDEVEWTSVLRNYRKDGTPFWNEFRTAAVHDEDEHLTHHIGVISDITERKEAEEALRSSEERFRTLVQNSSDMINVFGADGTVLYASPATERILGYEAVNWSARAPSTTCTRMMPAESWPRVCQSPGNEYGHRGIPCPATPTVRGATLRLSVVLCPVSRVSRVSRASWSTPRMSRSGG